MSRVQHPARGRMAGRQGMALLEAIVALTVFAIAGLSAVIWARQTFVAVSRAHTAVDAVSAASDYLDRIALWPREDLDRHLGVRREGPWLVEVERSTPTVYSVAVSDSGDRGTARPLLRTWLYRAELPTGDGHAR